MTQYNNYSDTSQTNTITNSTTKRFSRLIRKNSLWLIVIAISLFISATIQLAYIQLTSSYIMVFQVIFILVIGYYLLVAGIQLRSLSINSDIEDIKERLDRIGKCFKTIGIILIIGFLFIGAMLAFGFDTLMSQL